MSIVKQTSVIFKQTDRLIEGHYHDTINTNKCREFTQTQVHQVNKGLLFNVDKVNETGYLTHLKVPQVSYIKSYPALTLTPNRYYKVLRFIHIIDHLSEVHVSYLTSVL